jgi:K+-transporting ATPase ATPase B chain
MTPTEWDLVKLFATNPDKVLTDRTIMQAVWGAAYRAQAHSLHVYVGEIIPGDGEVVEGVAYVNEAAITGESAPVLKEPGTDIRSSVTGGTQVVSDTLRIQISADPGETFLDRMIALVEGAVRQKTPNEIALSILLAGLTIVFLLAVATLEPFAMYAGSPVSSVILIALLVCLIPTTIGGLLSAIGIAGMDRVTRFNVLAMSGRAVEAAGDVDVLLLDKTGTITFGNRLAAEILPVGSASKLDAFICARQSSLGDDTPEGRSIQALAEQLGAPAAHGLAATAEVVPFKAETRMSGVRQDGHSYFKGAAESIIAASGVNGRRPPEIDTEVERISRLGGTPLALMLDDRIVGVVYLKDTVKPGMRQRFDEFRRMGIKTIMVTGDNPLTAATIAEEAGVDDFVAQAKPEEKIRIIREQQADGHLVAMTGDGTNDAPALAQADVGLAMNSGTSAAKEAANMVDLDSNPTKLIEVVAIGKQLLITRGAITSFSVANDVAKYFAIIPAAFVATYPQLNALNVMQLATPESAILSAVIFNALIIIALVPLALRGVGYRPAPAAELLGRNLLIYGSVCELELEDYMQQHGIDAAWSAGERVMVCVDDQPQAQNLVRRGWRMANRYHTELLAVFVETPRWASVAPEHKRALEENLRFAEDLGAEPVRVQGTDVAQALMQVAHDRNVGSIVIGHSRHGRLHEILRGSIVQNLLRRAATSMCMWSPIVTRVSRSRGATRRR